MFYLGVSYFSSTRCAKQRIPRHGRKKNSTLGKEKKCSYYACISFANKQQDDARRQQTIICRITRTRGSIINENQHPAAQQQHRVYLTFLLDLFVTQPSPLKKKSVAWWPKRLFLHWFNFSLCFNEGHLHVTQVKDRTRLLFKGAWNHTMAKALSVYWPRQTDPVICFQSCCIVCTPFSSKTWKSDLQRM